MAKGRGGSSAAGSSGTGGAATRRTGAATQPRGGATRGFTPPGASTASGPAIRSGKSKWKPSGKTGYDVQK